ncbi:hypothetical protein ITJ38_04260 [Agreia pratensis]|uniref:DUF8094 domain-containing protein n=1 Tax=Agreia pratensis TaxID=150121 RepID=A0A1X7I0D0_9MICO|nr:hypothetical protein [Agreia pratensis]MBF4633615.1 hypothetical protein [Agreia pratensis]SMG07625.1 hypothetical protein SAMN06296010_0066 [Agreia pratensis]
MRFVFAIIAFVVATALIGVGVAQRTFLLPPGSVSAETSRATDEAYVLLDSDTLRANPGSQTVSLTGDSTVFVAYGRDADVKAWLNGSSYSQLAVDAGSTKLTEAVVPADPAGAKNVASGSANPAGSDLWLEQYTGEKSLTRTINVPAGYSAIIASNGTDPAPADITVAWPIDNSTPWAVPLLLSGAFVLLIGLALLLWGLWHMRRQQGPRRKPPAGTPRRRFSPARTNAIESGMSKRRKAITRSMTAVLPVVLVAALGAGAPLAASASTVTPTPRPTSTVEPDSDSTTKPSDMQTPTPTPTSTAPASEAVVPAVTEKQVQTIIERVIAVEGAANAAFDSNALDARFTGPALELRKASYAIHAALPDYVLPAAIPSGTASVILPQATTVWPKTVFTIIENEDKTVAPLAVTLVQESARANYKVEYAISLEPDTTLPPVSAASVGASRLAPDSKLLAMTPDAVEAAYADILAQGSASPSFGQIDTDGDTLLTSVGSDYKASKKAKIEETGTATIEFSKVPAISDGIALATNDSGAILSFNLRESEVVKPTQTGATITPEGAVKALSGLSATGKGVESTYDYQLLFYIPSAGETGKPTLLGFTQGLVQAKELP